VGLDAPSYAWRQQGSYTVTLTVTDDGNARGSDTLRVDVRNAPPTVDAGGPVLGREGEAVSFGPTVSDPGNDTLSYLWNFGDNTQPSTQARPAHTYRDDGVYEASVTVTDGTDATTAVVEVRVANVAPVVQAIAPVSADEGALVTLEARASDPGADALTYAWDFGDGNPLRGEGLGRVTRRFRDDPQGAGDGTFVVTVVVTDGDGGEATAVGEALIRNLPPTAEAGPAVQVAEGQEATLRGSATDPGSDVLTYAWDFGDGSPVEQGEGLSAPRHTYGAPGVYEVTLTVTDDDGASAVDATTVTVSDVAPSARIELAPEFPREGEPVSLRVVATGEALEVEGVEWGFGDGSASVAGVDEVTHTWGDDGEFVVSVVLRDDEGTEAQVTRAVVVDNAAPSIESAPPRLAQRGVRYEYQALGVDPGAQDALTWRLQEAPEGMSVGAEGLVTWEPEVTEGVFPVVLVLADEDGGQTSQAWSVTVGFDDADEDGVPDDCERRYGLNPSDPSDAELDGDGDGVSNRQECLRGSDPTQSGAPGEPSLDAPADGAVVSLGGLRLVVNNASDPDGDALRYDFEVSAEATLAQVLVREEGVAEQPSRTALDLRSREALLEEDADYWWRARACDASACGAWTRAYRFVRSDQDDAPSAPEARSPEGSVDEARPTLRAVAALDPEGGAVTHRFEVFEQAQPQTPLVVGSASEVVDGEVAWTLDEDLEDGVRYEWRVRGQDAQGQAGPWSARLAFEVNAANVLPPAPALVAPEDKAAVRSEGLALVVAHVDDPDGDALVYRFRLARGERVTLAGLVAESEDIVPDSRAVSWAPQGVEWVEDARYTWEAVAVDGEGEGEALRASFVLSDEDSLPPAPTLQSPSEGGVVAPSAANFVWLHAPDAEGGPLWYTVEVLDGEGSPGAVVSSPPVRFEGAAGARVEWTTDALEDNTRYRWRVVGTDAAGNLGAFSETWDFLVDAQPEAPSAPSLVSPVGGAQVEGGEGVALVWMESQDPEGAPLRYEVELDGPTSWSVEVDEAQATTPALEAGSWSWRVRALDEERASAWSDTGSFTVVGAQDEDETPSVTTGKKDGGCAVGAGRAGSAGWAWAAVAALLWWSRRRRA
jgi:PKD repeat protein